MAGGTQVGEPGPVVNSHSWTNGQAAAPGASPTCSCAPSTAWRLPARGCCWRPCLRACSSGPMPSVFVPGSGLAARCMSARGPAGPLQHSSTGVRCPPGPHQPCPSRPQQPWPGLASWPPRRLTAAADSSQLQTALLLRPHLAQQPRDCTRAEAEQAISKSARAVTDRAWAGCEGPLFYLLLDRLRALGGGRHIRHVDVYVWVVHRAHLGPRGPRAGGIARPALWAARSPAQQAREAARQAAMRCCRDQSGRAWNDRAAGYCVQKSQLAPLWHSLHSIHGRDGPGAGTPKVQWARSEVSVAARCSVSR